ncbi:TrkA family potassium uptake protein [Nanchangia anserum]|uniref:Trk system potassium uptake protein TrkA n=1 Tax=Nanchangia anserum TaxID=2692125 RepID=A0A8I0GDE7_9ACTO|nr:TrkA family potassium uptake protein [Nanchangia anserum]MBD3688827.1 TrkA family potassium uptake protein [Nanchangia anserum]QOX81102.1 TrkA family potassium uptake protein [Nanchangia anserum]
MYIIIVGAGSVGRSIARELLSYGHEVALIDQAAQKLQVAKLADADWLLADACDPQTLHQAEARRADVVVAATGDDKVNLVVSLLSKTEFAVPRTVARVNNPTNEWMFDDTWGVDIPVSTPRIMTSLVEEVVAEGTPVHLFRFHGSGTSLYSVTVPDGSPATGRRLSDLQLPVQTALVAILRDTHPFTPGIDSTIEIGDELLLLIPTQADAALTALREIFDTPAPEPEDLAQED